MVLSGLIPGMALAQDQTSDVAASSEAGDLELEAGDLEPESGGSAGFFDAPTWVALRSMAIPGWGQVKNHAWTKAALVMGIEGAFIERLIFEDRLVHEYRDKAYANPTQAEFYDRKEERHKKHRRDFIWWTSLFVLFSVGDAFVDAHLQGFDVDLDPAEGAGSKSAAGEVPDAAYGFRPGDGIGPRVRASWRIRW